MCLLDDFKSVDEMYSVLPPQLHDRYSMHVKDILCKLDFVNICPTTGKTTITYYLITVHAMKQ